MPDRALPIRPGQADRIVTATLLGQQLGAVFRSWGMSEEHTAITVEMMLYADLRGIDSHGTSMLPAYRDAWDSKALNVRPEIAVVRETATTALVDGGGGLGHVPAHTGMGIAIEKARAAGIGAVAVRNSGHYGAAGAYAERASRAGLIGVATTSTHKPAIVPTFATESMLGTNPLAFAAPAGRRPPFLLDMATSTVALGKITLAKRAGRPIPPGWAIDGRGLPLTDAAEACARRSVTPLGSTPEQSSHKGYGLAAMVEILSSLLSGSGFAGSRSGAGEEPTRVGHFLLALDPGAFREAGAFEAEVGDLIDSLHDARRVDPAQPVLVAGDPERAAYESRLESGIPLSRSLFEDLREIARDCGAPFLLDS
jgi:LDH2 family malate/lactate/ureidoglycolate dehydrogenase